MAATSGNAVVDTLLEENAAAPADPDRMYKSEWRTFKRTVNADSDMGCDADGRYLTRANVDIYFLRHVTERDINQNSAGRIAAALQFFADNEEHKPPAAQFIVRNAHVQKALQSHAAKRKAKQKRKYQDPHANLPTNILSPSDEDEVLHCGIASQNWEDFMVSWDSCNQTMFRGDSIRLARLCDLCFDDAHGPEHINESLTIVQQCGVGKKGEESKRVVGMWRHRDWKHCGTGMIAAALFVRFFTNVSIDFSKWNNTANQPEWYGEMLVGWRDYEPMRRYFKNIYAKAGVSWGKITHVRKMAIDIAKQGGASREDISQMSKHITDSIDIAHAVQSIDDDKRRQRTAGIARRIRVMSAASMTSNVGETETTPAKQQDGFLATLKALKQVVVQPAASTKQPVVQFLQNEKQGLLKQMDDLRRKSQQEVDRLQESIRESEEQHARDRKEWEQRVESEKEKAAARSKEMETQLVDENKRLVQTIREKEAALDATNDDCKGLEDSMIQLENENKTLRDRCDTLEASSVKLQAELNERTTAYEQSKVALTKINKLVSKAESHAAEISKYKQKMNEATTKSSSLEDKLDEKERKLSSLQKQLTKLEQTTQEQVAQVEAKLEQAKAEASDSKELVSVKATRASFLESKLEEKEGELTSVKKQLSELEQTTQEQVAQVEAKLQQAKAEASDSKELVSVKTTRVSFLESKLKEKERELTSVKKQLTEREQTTQEQVAQVEARLSIQQAKADVSDSKELASVKQQLQEKNEGYSKLEQQLQAETSDLQKKIASKDALLEAKEKMLKLVTAKSDSLKKKEAVLNETVAEMEDELKCAEEEVARCRAKIKEFESQESKVSKAVSTSDKGDETKHPSEATEKGQAASTSTKHAVSMAQAECPSTSTSKEVVDDSVAGETTKKRKAEDGAVASETTELDSMKAKLLAKKQAAKKKKT